MSNALEHHLPYAEPVQRTIGDSIVHFFESLGVPQKLYGDLVISYNPDYTLPDHTLQAWLVMIVFVAIAATITRKLKRVPEGGQHFLELPILGLREMLETVVGHGGAKHLPFMFTCASFIFLANVAGLAPFNMSPTNNLNITFGLALLSFFYYNYHGVKKNGLKKYLAHFFGPHLPIYLAPINLLMFPIEVISHLARPMSLAIRLFGNIMGEDIVLIILISLVPLLVPLPMMALMLFTGFLQAFVFTLLSIIYLAGAVAEEH